MAAPAPTIDTQGLLSAWWFDGKGAAGRIRPDEAVAAWKPGPATAVVTLSHDTKIDDPALQAALASDAAYVGALGSRKSHAARRERLAAAGVTPERIERIDGPVGIDIGAIGPAEIALSIAAAMVGAFNDRR